MNRPTKREVAQWNRFYQLSADPAKAAAHPVVVPAKKAIRQHSDDANAEKYVMPEVAKIISHNREVIFAVRQNSGGAKVIGKGGNEVPIWFYRIIKMPEPEVTIVDFWGIAIWGLFAIEAKRRDWKFSGEAREVKQQNFINLVIASGGRAGFATCAEDAKKILEEA